MNWLVEKLELSRGDGAANIRPMEGLRGFAVFLVFLVHYSTLVKPWVSHNSIVSAIAEAAHALGNIGVDLFFVLSGYLIYSSLMSRPQPFKQFISRRIKRIYPTFAVVFFAYVVLSFVFPEESKIPPSLIDGSIYLFQNFLLLPGMLPIEPMITVAWSLSYEMFYYLLTPLLFMVLGLRQKSSVWRACFFILAALAMLIAFALFGGPIRLVMFVAGILLYEAMCSRRSEAPSNEFALVFLIFVMGLTCLPVDNAGGYAAKICLLFLSFFALCFTCFAEPHSWLARAFSWAPLRWLGNMSYSYYLIHGLALKAGFLAVSMSLSESRYTDFLFWALLPVMFGITLIVSLLLYLLVERPLSLVQHKSHSQWANLLGSLRARR